MGQFKALLPFCGLSLIEYQINSLNQAGVSRTVVVLGHRSDNLTPLLEKAPAVEWINNPDYRQGKTTSIKAGIRKLLGADQTSRERAILVLNVDQPRTPDSIRRVMRSHLSANAAPSAPYLFTIPTYKGKGGHPIIIDASLLPELTEIQEGAQGIKALVRKYEDRTQRLEMETQEILLDLNTSEDYQAALEHFS